MSYWGLRGDALDVALDMVRRYPGAAITSGKRTIEDQAAAMAANQHRRRTWIEETYKDSVAKRACLEWCKAHPRATRTALQSGLLSVLRGLLPSELAGISLHLSGDAFDVQPEKARPEIAEWLRIQALKLGGKFIENEGGLLRWHWQASRREAP